MMQKCDITVVMIGIFVTFYLLFQTSPQIPVTCSASIKAVAQESTVTEEAVVILCDDATDGNQAEDVFEMSDDVSKEPVSSLMIYITESDIDLIARLLYLECRGESFECQKAIASVVFNRYLIGNYSSIAEVIYYPGAFSTSDYITSTTPTQVQYDAVREVIEHRATIPPEVIYFRANDYHTMADASDYLIVDNTYFSSSKKCPSEYIGATYDIGYTAQ